MGVQPFQGRGPHLSLWAGKKPHVEKTLLTGTLNHLNNYVTFKVYT